MTNDKPHRKDQQKKPQLVQVLKLIQTVISLAIGLGVHRLFSDPSLLFRAGYWGMIIGTPVLGLLLYWSRARYPFFYGTCEVIVGTITAERIISQGLEYVGPVVQFLAGLYIIVRGLDNIGKDVPERLQPLWDRCFGSKPRRLDPSQVA